MDQAAEKLGEDLGQWVVALRNDDRSWRYISDKLEAETGVAISGAWLRHQYVSLVDQGRAA